MLVLREYLQEDLNQNRWTAIFFMNSSSRGKCVFYQDQIIQELAIFSTKPTGFSKSCQIIGVHHGVIEYSYRTTRHGILTLPFQGIIHHINEVKIPWRAIQKLSGPRVSRQYPSGKILSQTALLNLFQSLNWQRRESWVGILQLSNLQ